MAGDGRVEDEDEGMMFEKMSKSANAEKSFESKTKGEGSSGLSSNMVGCRQVEGILGTRLSDHIPEAHTA
jgi:hypothetical protein